MLNSGRKLGISIYPASQSVEDMKVYIEKAAKLGYSRIFASMLEVTPETKERVLAKFAETFEFARKFNFDICLDVAPRVFETLGVTPSNLKIFNDLHATTLRLDSPFDGKTEAEMTFNEYGINIEINMSNGTEYISNIMSHKPLKDNLIACHNFYPQRFAGLDYDFFILCSELAKEHGLRTAAFVSSSKGNHGPWNVSDGLPSLEIHRNLNISTQAKHLWALGLIDDVLIGNAFASDEELISLSKINRYKVSISVKMLSNSSKIEKEIVELKNHFRRGDINAYSIRSTMSRVNYKKHDFPKHDFELSQTKGDILIGNDDFGIYKGELQLILNDMPNDPRKNLVARVVEDEKFLIDFIGSWDKFEFIVEE